MVVRNLDLIVIIFIEIMANYHTQKQQWGCI